MGVFDSLFRRKKESDDVVDNNSVNFDDASMREAQNLLNNNSISDDQITGEGDWHEIIKEYEIFKDNYFKNPVDDPSTPDKIFIRDISELENKMTEHIPKRVVEDEIIIKRLVEQESGTKPLDFEAVREAPSNSEYSNKMFEQEEGELGMDGIFDEAPSTDSHKVRKGNIDKEEVVMFSQARHDEQAQQDDFFNDFNHGNQELQDNSSNLDEDQNVEKTASPESFEDNLLDYLFGENEQKKGDQGNEKDQLLADENSMKNRVFLFSSDDENEISSNDQGEESIEKGKSKKAEKAEGQPSAGSSDAFLEYFHSLASSDGSDITVSGSVPSSDIKDPTSEEVFEQGEDGSGEGQNENNQTDNESSQSSEDFADFFSDLLQSAAVGDKTVAVDGDEHAEQTEKNKEDEDSYVSRVFLQRASDDNSSGDTSPEEAVRDKKRRSVAEKEVEGDESITLSEIFTDAVKKADAEIIEDETAKEQIEEVVVKQKEVKTSGSSDTGAKTVNATKKVVEQEVDDPFSLMMSSMMDELGDTEEVESKSGVEKERPISEFFFSDSSGKSDGLDKNKIDEATTSEQTKDKSTVMEKEEVETPRADFNKNATDQAEDGAHILNVSIDSSAKVNLEGLSDSEGIKASSEMVSQEQEAKAKAENLSEKADSSAKASSSSRVDGDDVKHDNSEKREKIKLLPVPREVVVNHHYPRPVPVLVREEVQVPVERIIETPQMKNEFDSKADSPSGSEGDMFSSAFVDQNAGWMPLSEAEKVGAQVENPTLVSSSNKTKGAGIVEKADTASNAVKIDETGEAEQAVRLDADSDVNAVGSKLETEIKLKAEGLKDSGESVRIDGSSDTQGVAVASNAVKIDETGEAEQAVKLDDDSDVNATINGLGMAKVNSEEASFDSTDGSGTEEAGGIGGSGVSVITDAVVEKAEDAPKKKRRRRRRRRKAASQTDTLEANVVGITEEESDIKITDEDATDSAEKIQIQKIEEVALAGEELTMHSSSDENQESQVAENQGVTQNSFEENTSLEDYFKTSFLGSDESDNDEINQQSSAFATSAKGDVSDETQPDGGQPSPDDWIGGGFNATNGSFEDKFAEAFSEFGAGAEAGESQIGSEVSAGSAGAYHADSPTEQGFGFDDGQAMGTSFEQSVGIPVLQDSDMYVDKSEDNVGTPISFGEGTGGDATLDAHAVGVPVGNLDESQQFDFGMNIPAFTGEPTFTGEPNGDSQLFGVPLYVQDTQEGMTQNVAIAHDGSATDGMDAFDLVYHNLATPQTPGQSQTPQDPITKPEKKESFFARLLKKIKEFLFKERGKKKEDEDSEVFEPEDEIVQELAVVKEELAERAEDIQLPLMQVDSLEQEDIATLSTQFQEETQQEPSEDLFSNMKTEDEISVDVSVEDTSQADELRTIHIKGIILGGVAGYDVVLENGSVVKNDIDADNLCLCSKDAVINGNITASKVVIYGVVRGNITASVSVEIGEGAMVFGDISSCSLIIDESALVQGNVYKSKSDGIV